MDEGAITIDEEDQGIPPATIAITPTQLASIAELPKTKRFALYEQVSEDDLRHYHAISCRPITKRAEDDMELVRRALRDADPRTTRVSDVASRYGFTNLGRFAMEFRQLYGESPSKALRGA